MAPADEATEAVTLQSHSPPLTFRSEDIPFRLFDLPRELRDEIYDYSLAPLSEFKILPTHGPRRDDGNDVLIPSTPTHSSDGIVTRPSPPVPGLLASVQFRPRTNILLGNSTLRQEYGDRSKQAITLVLKDNENYSFQHINLPEPGKEVYWAELHLILFCHGCLAAHANGRLCQASHEISAHRVWIEKLLSSQLPKLRSFSAHVYLCHDYYYEQPSAKKKNAAAPCESIVLKKIRDLYSLPKLKTLRLYKYSFLEHHNLDGPKQLLFEWPPRPQTAKNQKDAHTQTEATEVKGAETKDTHSEDAEHENGGGENAETEDADADADGDVEMID